MEELKLVAARLYGRGFARAQIARSLAKQLCPNAHPDKRLKQARSRLAIWEKDQKFRDLVWNEAVVKLDMSTPQILVAMAGSAKKGRVDAAKLALEVTGRHTSQQNTQVTAVQVNIANGIPRPEGSA